MARIDKVVFLSFQTRRIAAAKAAIEVNLQAALAALSQVLCNYKKRPHA